MGGARTFTELDAWKLANELKIAIYRVMSRPPVARDIAFRDQLSRAAEVEPLLVLAKRASAATAARLRYLRTARPPRSANPEP
jgi:hypothetical protein